MIAYLHDWFESNYPRLEALGLSPHLVDGPSDRLKHSAWIDLEGRETMCRITLWETGESDVQFILLQSGEPAMEHKQVRSEVELAGLLDELVSRVTPRPT